MEFLKKNIYVKINRIKSSLPYILLDGRSLQNLAFREVSYQYKYNGKELQETGMYDYGTRMMMRNLGRWGAMDAMSEKYSTWSPYNYAINNPVMVIDPDGNDVVNISGGMMATDADAAFAFKAYVATMSTSSETSGSLRESFSRPMFQFPKGQEEYYQKTYPAFYNFVKNQLPNIIKDSNFLQAFMDITGMSQEEVTKAFTYGQGPIFHDAYLPFGEGQYDYSVSGLKEDINKISIDIIDTLNWFEKANKNINTIEGVTNVFFMATVIGHEGTHWGNNIKGPTSEMSNFIKKFSNEHGNAFEFRLFQERNPDAKIAPGILYSGHAPKFSSYLKDYVSHNFQMLSNIFKSH